jgi:hypothetical protein
VLVLPAGIGFSPEEVNAARTSIRFKREILSSSIGEGLNTALSQSKNPIYNPHPLVVAIAIEPALPTEISCALPH